MNIGLGGLIEWLEQQDPDGVLPLGFGAPMSYRGYYEDLAFEPVEDARIGDMLEHARSALGKTFEGYKGGDFKMEEYTTCWIAEYGRSGGASIGEYLLRLWEKILAAEQPETLHAELAAERQRARLPEELVERLTEHRDGDRVWSSIERWELLRDILAAVEADKD